MADWYHLGSVYGDMRGYNDKYPMEPDEALTQAVEEFGTHTAHQKGQFRTGYYVGIAGRFIRRIQGLVKYMNRDQIAALGHDLEALYVKHYEITFGEKPDTAK